MAGRLQLLSFASIGLGACAVLLALVAQFRNGSGKSELSQKLFYPNYPYFNALQQQRYNPWQMQMMQAPGFQDPRMQQAFAPQPRAGRPAPSHVVRSAPSHRATVAPVLHGKSTAGLVAAAGKLERLGRQRMEQGQRLVETGERQVASAKEADALGVWLKQAQDDLSVYKQTAAKLVKQNMGLGGAKRKNLKNYAAEEAEIHAMLDHSLSEADSAAVKMQKNSHTAVKALSGAQAQGKLAAHGAQGVAHLAAAHGQAVLKPAQKAQQLRAKGSAKVPASVRAVMKKLKAVKAFEKKELEHHDPAALRHQAAVMASKGESSMLVQPAPLLGALPVKGGEVVGDGLKYNPEEVGLPDEDPDAIKNASHVHYDVSKDKALLCNSTCQHEILHSTIGLTFKVATKCVEECAHSDFIMKTKGEPLPQWKNVDELQEQDEICRGSEHYRKCKTEELDPVCDKLTEFMPNHCLEKPNEGICVQCRQLEEDEHKDDEEELIPGLF